MIICGKMNALAFGAYPIPQRWNIEFLTKTPHVWEVGGRRQIESGCQHGCLKLGVFPSIIIGSLNYGVMELSFPTWTLLGVR